LLKTVDQLRIETIRGWLVCASQVSTLWHGMQPARANHGPPARRHHHYASTNYFVLALKCGSLESLDSHTV
jgi:hypothetical protein